MFWSCSSVNDFKLFRELWLMEKVYIARHSTDLILRCNDTLVFRCSTGKCIMLWIWKVSVNCCKLWFFRQIMCQMFERFCELSLRQKYIGSRIRVFKPRSKFDKLVWRWTFYKVVTDIFLLFLKNFPQPLVFWTDLKFSSRSVFFISVCAQHNYSSFLDSILCDLF